MHETPKKGRFLSTIALAVIPIAVLIGLLIAGTGSPALRITLVVAFFLLALRGPYRLAQIAAGVKRERSRLKARDWVEAESEFEVSDPNQARTEED